MLQVATAPQTNERERDCVQEGTESPPVSLTVAPEEFKQTNDDVQTCGENPLASVTAPQTCKKRRQQLKKNNRMLNRSLNLESAECQSGRKKISKNIKIQTASLLKNGDTGIRREALQDSGAYDSSSCKSKNVVLPGKDCSKQDSELVDSRTDELQKVSIYGTYCTFYHRHTSVILVAGFIIKNITTHSTNYVLSG
jgi:hypothetical protein